MMHMIEHNILQSKFRGALYGALVGDCLGAPFENEKIDKGSKLVLKKYLDKLEGPMFKTPQKSFTDDTAMTKSVLRTLIVKNEINQEYLAKNFVKEFFTDPHRGYGEAVVEVFQKLRKSNCENPTSPAYEQFEGSGSYGNGAAMRVAPIALFCHSKPQSELIRQSTLSAEITHTNKLGIDGAILQAMAVHQSLLTDPKTTEFNAKSFVENLISKFDSVEYDSENLGIKLKYPYHKQLEKIIYFLENPERAHDYGIIEQLGNNVTALHSVPTAIYSFIRGQDSISGIETTNPFRRTIEYAISLGGDTDTIASMAGAICGAYHGEEVIAENFLKHSENYDEIKNLSHQLFEKSLL